jgi:serine/threonine-protein kinase
MVTGRKAFEGKSQASLIGGILERDPVPVPKLQPMAPAALSHVVTRCLAKDPDERWQHSRDVLTELGWASEAEPEEHHSTPTKVTATHSIVPKPNLRRSPRWRAVWSTPWNA